MQLEAHAKVNLFLEIVGRRNNGYHDLRSVVAPIALHDTLVLEPSDRIETRVESSPASGGSCRQLPSSEDNLTTRAARALQALVDTRQGVIIHLTKRIPIGGGLGGGSADAAAVLRGLCTLWDLDISRDRLVSLASTLGCDIPALLHGGMVAMEGLGESVVPLHLAPSPAPDGKWWLVVANPGFCVSTRDIYERLQGALTSPAVPYNSVRSALNDGDLSVVAQGLYNGLEDTVVHKYPLIGILRDHMREAGALGAMVSGSGASVFGLARDVSHAQAIAAQVETAIEGSVWCRTVALVPDSVMAAHGPLEA